MIACFRQLESNLRTFTKRSDWFFSSLKRREKYKNSKGAGGRMKRLHPLKFQYMKIPSPGESENIS